MHMEVSHSRFEVEGLNRKFWYNRRTSDMEHIGYRKDILIPISVKRSVLIIVLRSLPDIVTNVIYSVIGLSSDVFVV